MPHPSKNSTTKPSNFNPEVSADKFGKTAGASRESKYVDSQGEIYWQEKFEKQILVARNGKPFATEEEIFSSIDDFIFQAVKNRAAEERSADFAQLKEMGAAMINGVVGAVKKFWEKNPNISPILGLGLMALTTVAFGARDDEKMSELTKYTGDTVAEYAANTAVAAFTKYYAGVPGLISFLAVYALGRFPVAEAKMGEGQSSPKKSSKPRDKVKTPSAEQIKKYVKKQQSFVPSFTRKIDRSKLRISHDKLYTYDDFSLSFHGLKRLSKRNYRNPDESIDNLSFYPIKKSELAKIVGDDDKEAFKKLCERGARHIKSDLKRVRGITWSIILEYGNRLDKNKIEETYEFFANKLIKKFNLKESKASIVKKLDEIFEEVREVIRKETGSSVKLEARYIASRHVFENLVKDKILVPSIDKIIEKRWESWWNKIKKRDLALKTQSQELLSLFHEAEEAALSAEKFDDRLLKAGHFAGSDHAMLVLHPKSNSIQPNAISSLNQFDQFYSRYYIDKDNMNDFYKLNYSSIYTHEPMHVFDFGMSREIVSEKPIYDSKDSISMPCGNEDYKDRTVSGNMVKAFEIDKDRFYKFHEELSGLKFANDQAPKSAIKKYHYPEMNFLSAFHMEKGFTNVMEMGGIEALKRNYAYEIIPRFTDRVTDPVLFVKCFPNMAVMRSYIISVRDAENQPYIEAQFYSAVMQCDANKVKEIIKKDPDIFYKTYDGIALHELPKLLVESGYDKYVDANFKKGGKDNKNNYSAINGIVSEGYKRAEKARVRNIEVLSTRDSASYHTDL